MCVRHAWKLITQIWMKLRVLKDKLGEVFLFLTLQYKMMFKYHITGKMYRSLIFLTNEQGGHSLKLAGLLAARETKQLDSLVNFQLFFSGLH